MKRMAEGGICSVLELKRVQGLPMAIGELI